MTVSTPRFIHISVNYLQGVDLNAVQEALELEALDWLRYAVNCYILWTKSDVHVIAGRLLTVPGMNANYFWVCKLDFSESYGFFPQWIWEWLRQDRSQRPVYSLPSLPPVPPPIRRK